MWPTLRAGDVVLVNYRSFKQRPPAPGDVVVAVHPYRSELKMVKRVTAVLKNGNFLLAGDNPRGSTDSRHYGPVATRDLHGLVTSVWLAS